MYLPINGDKNWLKFYLKLRTKSQKQGKWEKKMETRKKIVPLMESNWFSFLDSGEHFSCAFCLSLMLYNLL